MDDVKSAKNVRRKRILLRNNLYVLMGYLIVGLLLYSSRLLNLISTPYSYINIYLVYCLFSVLSFHSIIQLKALITDRFNRRIYIVQFINWFVIFLYTIFLLNEIRIMILMFSFIGLIFTLSEAGFIVSFLISSSIFLLYLGGAYFCISILQHTGSFKNELFYAFSFLIVGLFTSLASGNFKRQRDNLREFQRRFREEKEKVEQSKKRIEEQSKKLQESEGRFRKLIDASFEGVLVFRRGIILEINEELANLVSYTPDEVIGKHVLRFVADESKDAILNLLPNTILNDIALQRKDGSKTYVEMVTAEHIFEGLPVFVVGIRDITQKKVLEALKVSDSLKDEFLSNLSHELRTPLSEAFGFAELLKDMDDIDPEEVKTYSDEIYKNCSKLIDYIDDIMLIIDIETRPAFRLNDTDLSAIIQRSLEKFSSIIDELNIQINLEINNEVSVQVDEHYIEKAVDSVIKNAIVYNKKNGELFISLEKINDGVKLSVHDTGIGIPYDKIERIWDKFYRIDTSLTYKTSGVGIGLFLAKRIFELHGGTISVESEEGKGSLFIINIC